MAAFVGQPTVEKSEEKGDNGQQEANDHTGSTESSGARGGGGDATAGSRGLFGYSGLHAASSNGNAKWLSTLLADGSNVSLVNSKTVDGGYTPLHLAASAGHADCVEELLDCNETDIHVTDAFGRTPLETAEQNFKNDVAMLLRSHGKNIDLLSNTFLLQIANTCGMYWLWVDLVIKSFKNADTYGSMEHTYKCTAARCQA